MKNNKGREIIKLHREWVWYKGTFKHYVIPVWFKTPYRPLENGVTKSKTKRIVEIRVYIHKVIDLKDYKWKSLQIC